eukprot:CAMPEP_0167753824 /NCGR_PEP_ID=MMETSP0110_2-20121227/7929_1 /TAXON_ID=629695 /ORGANISM="Gymnochlora sp., Strain CCMP2014" /LENGTH=362 /DNA_ID=CAMNT_0007639635 /DNA_START=210 /DNA_END=1298 /DNA_ORIENTATION=+
MERNPWLDSWMLSFGPIMVVFAAGLIGSVIYIGMFIVLPLLVVWRSWNHWAHIIWAIFLSVNVSFNYILGVITDPGSHKSDIYKKLCKEAKQKGMLDNIQEDPLPGPSDWTSCKKTNLPKPPRAHFDSTTKRLVIHMDHYCPWLFNTVGWANLRYYIMVQVYVVISTIYIVYMTFSSFSIVLEKANHDDSEKKLWNIGNDVIVDRNQKFYIIYLFVVSFAVTNLIGLFLAWNLYLVFTGQTTIEYKLNSLLSSRSKKAIHESVRYVNPYDQGLWKNWSQAMGRTIMHQFLPNWSQPPWPPYPTLVPNLPTGWERGRKYWRNTSSSKKLGENSGNISEARNRKFGVKWVEDTINMQRDMVSAV